MLGGSSATPIGRGLACLALLAAAAPAHAERMCEQGPLRPMMLGGQAEVAGSGGVIVIFGTRPPDWRFRDVNRSLRARVVTLAPGLALFYPPPLARSLIELEDTLHESMGRTRRALVIDPPAAPPAIEAITYAPTGSPTNRERGLVTVELVKSAPPRVFLVMVSRVEGEKLVPLSWGQVRSGDRQRFTAWHTPGPCESTIEGTVEPKVGERVVVTWVDDAGRVSEPSEPFTITRARVAK